jgi:fibronectin-binding autotransporter adhesin
VATITNSRFVGNSATQLGGAVATIGASTMTITGSVLLGNTALIGAGVFTGLGDGGSTRLTNCTLAQNHAAMAGGAIFDRSGTTSTVSFATVADNRVDAPAGAALETGGPGSILVKNSIVASTTDVAGAPRANCAGTIVDLGGNLSTDGSCPSFTVVSRAALSLGPLALNPPGNTETMALLPGSVAIDAAPTCTDSAGSSVTTDQRGVARPQGPACDVGAFEFVPPPPPSPPPRSRFAVPQRPLFVSDGTCGCGRVRRPFRPVTWQQ